MCVQWRTCFGNGVKLRQECTCKQSEVAFLVMRAHVCVCVCAQVQCRLSSTYAEVKMLLANGPVQTQTQSRTKSLCQMCMMCDWQVDEHWQREDSWVDLLKAVSHLYAWCLLMVMFLFSTMFNPGIDTLRVARTVLALFHTENPFWLPLAVYERVVSLHTSVWIGQLQSVWAQVWISSEPVFGEGFGCVLCCVCWCSSISSK